MSVEIPTVYYYTIFQQLFNFIPRYRFEKSVKELSGDHYKKKFSTNQQFLTCLYAQITGKDSLREIERGLITNHNRLYHLGMTAVAKSTLADAMNRRNPDMFKALYEEILDRAVACAPYTPQMNARMENFIRALKLECLDKIIFRSPEQLRYAIDQFQEYWNHYRPHAELGGKMVLPYAQAPNEEIQEISFLGGLLHGYRRVPAAA